ncbi:MAG: helix-turn-helix domain-containing protein [Desulfovibrio sp.]
MGSVQKLFGKKVRLVRRNREMTQERLAELSGLSLQYIGEIERGRRNPSLTSIEQLSMALNLPLSTLFDVEEFRLSSQQLRQILVDQIAGADEERLRAFYKLAQVLFR